jgi:hypothetical protein
MKLLDFFDQVPRLSVVDPLAELLGCTEDGVLEYSYSDAVRLTGHSCPTVAAAYWLTWLSLKSLYPDTLPERGGVRVEFQEGARSGSTGVVAAVVQLLTGAAGSTGFKGLAGRFNRAGLIRFSPELLLSLRFTRIDTGDAVDAAADLSLAPSDPALEPLLARCVHGHASLSERKRFGELWQARVKTLLLDLAHDPDVYVVRPAEKRGLRISGKPSEERRERMRHSLNVAQLPS